MKRAGPRVALVLLLIVAIGMGGTLLMLRGSVGLVVRSVAPCPAGRASGPAPDHGPISQREVIAIACAQAPSSTTPRRVLSVTSGILSGFMSGSTPAGISPNRRVWAVLLSGTFPPASCGPPAPRGTHHSCPSPEHTAHVVLDYHTGKFLTGSVP